MHDRLAIDGAGLVMRVLEALATGRAVETPQDESLATLAPKLSRESASIDWGTSAAEIARKIRAMYPWPGARVCLCDAEGATVDTLRLVRARALPTDEGSRWSAGELMTDGSVRAGSGAVELVEIQPDGKTPMALIDYRRGNPWMPGMKLTPA
jgi:methionyl-tRNA formyltransferase